MSKEHYFEMCEALGSEPIESEIPTEYEDLNDDVKLAFGIYSKLKDEWDSVGGRYLGKSYVGIVDIFDILEVPVEDRRIMFDLIGLIDEHRSAAISEKLKRKK